MTQLSFDPSLNAGARPADLSAWEIVWNSYRFFFAGWRPLLAAIWLPTGLAAAVLFGLFKIYFVMLARFLDTRDVRLASLTVSLVILGLLLWLLLNVVSSARVARLMDGRAATHPTGTTGLTVEARLFAATLRCLLVLLLCASIPMAAIIFVARQFPPEYRFAGAGLLAVTLAVVLCIAFLVRCGLLVPALVQFDVRTVLRRSWQLTRGHFWNLLFVWTVAAALPAVLLQFLGELWTRPIVAAEGGVTSLAAAARHLAADDSAMIGIVVTLTLSTCLYVVLTTIASCMTYRALIKRS